MATINVTSLKAKLSEKLAEVHDEGASFIVTDRHIPIARLVPIGSEEELLIERKATGSFKPVRPGKAASVKIDWEPLLAAERGDR